MIIRSFRKESFLWSSLIVASIIYALISFVNQHCFRTYALDLGAYTNALYDYAHFSWNDSSTFNEVPENLLADHFDLYLPLFSPLIYIFGTYTLLVVQLVAVLFGAVGIYRYITFRFPETNLNKFALVSFLLFFGIFAAFSFDYHSNVVATMFIPWLLLAFAKQKIRNSIIWTLLILISKENMALWLFFIGLGLLVQNYRNKQLRNTAIGISVLSLSWFVLITGFVMPALSNHGTYPHFHYSILGNNAGEALKELLTHPLDNLRLLFVNHTNDPANNFVKAEFWVVIGVSGIFCFIGRPVYLLMLIPIFAQKLFHDNVAMWGINQHYAIEFAPLIVIGTFESIAKIRNKNWAKAFCFVALACSLACTIRVMDNTIAYCEKARIRIYKAAHYRNFPIQSAHTFFKFIPDDVAVSANSVFIPHLALRESAYQFPIIRDAKYILLLKTENTYPLSLEEYESKTDSLLQSPDWKILKQNETFLLLKKTQFKNRP